MGGGWRRVWVGDWGGLDSAQIHCFSFTVALCIPPPMFLAGYKYQCGWSEANSSSWILYVEKGGVLLLMTRLLFPGSLPPTGRLLPPWMTRNPLFIYWQTGFILHASTYTRRRFRCEYPSLWANCCCYDATDNDDYFSRRFSKWPWQLMRSTLATSKHTNIRTYALYVVVGIRIIATSAHRVLSTDYYQPLM